MAYKLSFKSDKKSHGKKYIMYNYIKEGSEKIRTIIQPVTVTKYTLFKSIKHIGEFAGVVKLELLASTARI